jgi:hypothetical protein
MWFWLVKGRFCKSSSLGLLYFQSGPWFFKLCNFGWFWPGFYFFFQFYPTSFQNNPLVFSHLNFIQWLWKYSFWLPIRLLTLNLFNFIPIDFDLVPNFGSMLHSNHWTSNLCIFLSNWSKILIFSLITPWLN